MRWQDFRRSDNIEEGSATGAYTRALLAFRRQGDTPEARRLLRFGPRTEVFDTGNPITVPVGEGTLGRVFNVTGDPGSLDHLSPFTFPMKSPFSTWLMPPEPTQSPWFSE